MRRDKAGILLKNRVFTEWFGVQKLTTRQNFDDLRGLEKDMKEAKIIKRYQNRKLYDTQESSYVTLDEIARMIKAGDDVRVIDNKTKNDITAATLTQLLYESERKSKTQPSVDLLKNIIRNGDGSFSGFITNNMGGNNEAMNTNNTAMNASISSSNEINQ